MKWRAEAPTLQTPADHATAALEAVNQAYRDPSWKEIVSQGVGALTNALLAVAASHEAMRADLRELRERGQGGR